jgi:hypothetical protein
MATMTIAPITAPATIPPIGVDFDDGVGVGVSWSVGGEMGEVIGIVGTGEVVGVGVSWGVGGEMDEVIGIVGTDEVVGDSYPAHAVKLTL